MPEQPKELQQVSAVEDFDLNLIESIQAIYKTPAFLEIVCVLRERTPSIPTPSEESSKISQESMLRFGYERCISDLLSAKFPLAKSDHAVAEFEAALNSTED